MSAMLPSSKLLPATVVVASLVLGLKVVAMATTLPTFAGLQTKGVLTQTSAVDARIMLPKAAAAPSEPNHRVSAQRGPTQESRIAASPIASPLIASPSPTGHALPIQSLSIQGVSLQGAAVPPVILPPPVPAVLPTTLSVQSLPVQPAPIQPLVSAQMSDVPVTTPDALKVRRSEIEERERKLVEREATVAAADKRLSERVGELTALQARLQALEGGLKERDEANWAGIVKTYEGMRPKDAASIFNALDKVVLLEILDRMKPAKATPIIAAMDPERARQVTADLSLKRTRSTTVAN